MKLNKSQREEVKMKFGGFCSYCGELLGDKWQADHLIPIRRNGDGTCLNPEHDVIENLMPACRVCNNNKRSMSLESWRDLLAHYRDVQLLRDSGTARHLHRFGLLEIKKVPVVFYFEQVK
ncbi:HNH endonuclease [Acinetobacter ursingii]|uniref:HNH endonuclease n=1 Tax=Acinetobacter ursingii TaxID=108980 RepID=UPI003AF530CB